VVKFDEKEEVKERGKRVCSCGCWGSDVLTFMSEFPTSETVPTCSSFTLLILTSFKTKWTKQLSFLIPP